MKTKRILSLGLAVIFTVSTAVSTSVLAKGPEVPDLSNSKNLILAPDYNYTTTTNITKNVSDSKFLLAESKNEIDQEATSISELIIQYVPKLFKMNVFEWSVFGEYVKKAYSMIKSRLYNRECKKACISDNASEVCKKLDLELKKVQGQDEAVKAVKNSVCSMMLGRELAKFRDPECKFDPRIIYLIGPSGVGKTMAAEGIAKALLPNGCKICEINESAVRSKDVSIADQLFGTSANNVYYQYDQGGMKERKAQKNALLADRIKANPNTVIIINEYDKMQNEEFDSLLRGIIDNKSIVANGKEIDCSGLLIIITSNESLRSMTVGSNLEQKSNLEQEDNSLHDDGTGSRTQRKHDKSFLNRLTFVEFNKLEKDALLDIAKDSFENNLVTPCYEKYNVNLSIPDASYELMAKRAYESNEGARWLNKKVFDDLKTEVIKMLLGDNLYKDASNKKCSITSIFKRNKNEHFRYDETVNVNAIYDGNGWLLQKAYQSNQIQLIDKNQIIEDIKENQPSITQSATVNVNDITNKDTPSELLESNKSKSESDNKDENKESLHIVKPELEEDSLAS